MGMIFDNVEGQASDSVIICGYWYYYDRGWDPSDPSIQITHARPIKNALIEIWDEDGFDQDVFPYNDDDLLAVTYTDEDGYFEYEITNNDLDEGGNQEIYVAVHSENRNSKVIHYNGFAAFEQRTTTYSPVSDGSVITIPDQYFGEDFLNDLGQKGVPFHILETVDNIHNWVLNEVGWERNKIEIRCPLPNEVGYIDHYSISEDIIYHSVSGGWDQVTIAHEYAHAIMGELYGMPSGTGPPGDDGHEYYMESSEGFAFLEGWAEFFSGAVYNNATVISGFPWYEDDEIWINSNLERNHWERGPDYNSDLKTWTEDDANPWDGDIVEGAVASVLWDIYDDNTAIDMNGYDKTQSWNQFWLSDGFDISGCDDYYTESAIEPTSIDGFSLGFDEIFSVLKDNAPNDIHEFWDGWFNNGYADTGYNKHWIKSIYYNHGIKKNDGINALSENPPLISNFQINSASNNFNANSQFDYSFIVSDPDIEDYAPGDGILNLNIRLEYFDGAYWIEFSRKKLSEMIPSGSYFSDSISIDLIPDGSWEIQAVVDDDMMEASSNTFSIHVDKTRPEAPWGVTNIGSVSNPIFTWVEPYDASGVDHYLVWLDGTTYNVWDSVWQTPVSYGYHYFRVLAVDNYGNYGLWSNQISVYYPQSTSGGDTSTDPDPDPPPTDYSPPGSGSPLCPYVYTWDGNQYNLDNNLLPLSENYQRDSLNVFDSYLIEQPLVENSGLLPLGLFEFENEQSFFDYVSLDTIDHPINTGVAQKVDGSIIGYNEPLTIPIQFTDESARNLLQEVSIIDDYGIAGDEGYWAEFDFGSISEFDNLNLILRANSRPEGTTTPNVYPPPGWGKWIVSLKIQLQDDTGNWVGVETISPREEYSKYIVDLKEYYDPAMDSLKIRVVWTKFHRLDFIGLDTGPTVSLQYKSTSLVNATHTLFGNLTNYLDDVDNLFAELQPNEWLSLNFTSPELDYGMERNYILNITGYYKTLRSIGVSHDVDIKFKMKKSDGDVDVWVTQNNRPFYKVMKYQTTLHPNKPNSKGDLSILANYEYEIHYLPHNETTEATLICILSGQFGKKVIKMDLTSDVSFSIDGYLDMITGGSSDEYSGNITILQNTKSTYSLVKHSYKNYALYNVSNVEWDFGDGSSASGLSLSHVFTQPGTYVITANITVYFEDRFYNVTEYNQVEVLESSPSKVRGHKQFIQNTWRRFVGKPQP